MTPVNKKSERGLLDKEEFDDFNNTLDHNACKEAIPA